MSQDPAAAPRASILLRAQYIKDLSFENPRAPGSLFSLREAPAMEVNVNLGAQRLDGQVVELSFQFNVRAVAEKATVFMIDLAYAGILEMQQIPEEAMEQAIFVQGAQLIYPFARRVIADVTRDGGFPPLQLEPLDFMTMYLEQKNRSKDQKASA
jgi:preprotein translocase subunit SecB